MFTSANVNSYSYVFRKCIHDELHDKDYNLTAQKLHCIIIYFLTKIISL